MVKEMVVTKEEQKAIKALQRLAKKWPQSIMLFSWAGSLVVTKDFKNKMAIVAHITGVPTDGGDPECGDGIEATMYYEEDVDIIYK